MLGLISILLAAAVGMLLILAFDPVSAMQPRWAAATFRAALGTGVGIGISSILFFIIDVTGAATPAVIFALDAALVALAAWLYLRRRAVHRESPAPESAPGARGFRWTWLLASAFGIAFAASCIRIVQMALALPVGDWDAWAMWNLRAKFLAGPPGAWRHALSPLLANLHPDYPLLLPSFVARAWRASGSMDAIAPALTSLLFFIALVVLLVSAMALLRGSALAMLAGLVLLSTTSLLNWAPAQYADIPMAFYYLSAVALLLLSAANSEPWPLLWAGLSASFAAWTKNEGIVFLAAVLAVSLLVAMLRRDGSGAISRFSWLAAGAIPGVALTLWLKFFLAPVSDPLFQQGTSSLARLHEGARYAGLADELFKNLLNLGSGVAHPFILLAILAILVGWNVDPRYRVPALGAAAILALVFLAYCGVLLITPNAFSWQLQTALDRLILQVWPGALLIFFVFLRRIADSVTARVPAKSATSRKVPAKPAKSAPAASPATRGIVK